jgi:hypothetical protein
VECYGRTTTRDPDSLKVDASTLGAIASQARVGAWIASCSRYCQSPKVMVPPLAMGGDLICGKAAMRKANQRAAVIRCEVDFDQRRTWWDLLASFPTKGVRQPRNRNDFLKLAACDETGIYVDEHDSATLWFDLRRHSHPANQPFRIGEEREDGRGVGVNPHLTLYRFRCSHPTHR